jgi:hypothetical protein
VFERVGMKVLKKAGGSRHASFLPSDLEARVELPKVASGDASGFEK